MQRNSFVRVIDILSELIVNFSLVMIIMVSFTSILLWVAGVAWLFFRAIRLWEREELAQRLFRGKRK